VPIFKVRISPIQRSITSIDGADVVLFAATSCGFIAGFDLRFALDVTSFNQSETTGIKRVTRIKYAPEGLYVSTIGNSNVTLWDNKLGQRSKLLHTHNSSESKASTTVNAILPITSPYLSQSSAAVITGGTDMRIRYWDLLEPERSYIISDPLFKACYHLGRQSYAPNSSFKSPTEHNNYVEHAGSTPPLATFVSRQVTDHQIIEEMDASATFKQLTNNHFCSLSLNSISSGHQDTITDLLRVNQYLVSAGRNGTVKVWR